MSRTNPPVQQSESKTVHPSDMPIGDFLRWLADTMEPATATHLNVRARQVDDLAHMLEDALPCVEESEQFHKPSCRGLSLKIRAALTKAKP